MTFLVSSVQDIMTSAAVRSAAQRMLSDARANTLLHWQLHENRLPQLARLVADVTRKNYPTLEVPFHSRWRHFTLGGVDRWMQMHSRWSPFDAREKARTAFDLAIISVLVDAGSGPHWSFRDPASSQTFRASEGLALASLELFEHCFSPNSGAPAKLSVADRLLALTPDVFARIFQVREDNPLNGVEGRVALLNSLGAACKSSSHLFAPDGSPRPGGLVDVLAEKFSDGVIKSDAILALVLEAFGSIWPARQRFDGLSLGDAWYYPRWSRAQDIELQAIVPFHKLSQWLTYSLIEPLQEAHYGVTHIDELTGLAEYRNGGLFVDEGALVLRDPANAELLHEPASPLVIEWRAMTVALLDELHPLVAKELGFTLEQFPLARLLEGGTWAAGRWLAKQNRPDGLPPISIVSDGTVF